MNFLTVPLGNDFPWYKFKITLTGVIFSLRLRYNTRMSRWFLDLSDSSENILVCGLPVLLERNIFGQYVMSGLPEGTFFVTDDTNRGNQPTRYSFGTSHTFFYADPEE